MRLTIRLNEFESIFDQPLESIIIGRISPGKVAPDLDLSPDLTVSRPHARLFQENGTWWLEDLGSAHGTQLCGGEIRGLGPQRIRPGDTFQCGATLLRPHLDPVTKPIETVKLPPKPVTAIQDEAALRLGKVLPSLLREVNESELDEHLRQLVERTEELIPSVRRVALLLKAGEGDSLLLAAFHGLSGPVVSETLARQAISTGESLLYKGEEDFEQPTLPGASLARYAIASAILAPLISQGEAVGVLYADNGEPGATTDANPFTEEDLGLLEVLANHMASALVNRRLREALRRETTVKENLLRQFSPQFRDHLLNPGGVKISGERSEVTILASDIRGFSALTRNMEPTAIVELLNDYISKLTPIIWQYEGAIDKYIGDGILAVFGSPAKDPQQHEHALRAALEMQAEMARVNAARRKAGKITCEIGIGVHCGQVLHGFIGAVDQVNLTIIGDPVNRASRYCDGAAGGEVMMSPQVYQWVWKEVQTAPAQIHAKHGETFPAFRLLAFNDAKSGS